MLTFLNDQELNLHGLKSIYRTTLTCFCCVPDTHESIFQFLLQLNIYKQQNTNEPDLHLKACRYWEIPPSCWEEKTGGLDFSKTS